MTESKPYRIYTGQRKRYVTIPDVLADQADMQVGGQVTWEIRDDKSLILRKARQGISLKGSV